MSHESSPPAPPPLVRVVDNFSGWALFLDFDGTLVDLAVTPDAIVVPEQLPHLLQTLCRRFGGALAIVTGRALVDLDRHLGGMRLRAIGQHGAERRIDPAGYVPARAEPAIEALRPRVRAFAEAHAGVLVEDKGAALALHFRAVPEYGPAVQAFAETAAAESGGRLQITPGKAVCEIHATGADKGSAISAFLRQAPFCGRRPLVLGDDVTDEAAFATALAAGGCAVKVGEGKTRAPWRLADVAATRRWLAEAVPGDPA